jgi:deoxyribonuclease-4
VRLGAHQSIDGGLDRAVVRAREAGCEVLQVFTRNSNQWRAKSLAPEEIARFREALAREGIDGVSAHGSYLINMASPDEVLYRRSVEAFGTELDRCEALGIPSLIVHPGSHVGSGLEAGITRIVAALDEALAARPGAVTRVLLEVWAGQGSTIGGRFEEIGEILLRVREPGRVGVCFDTCHAFAAGYDLRTRAGYEETFATFDRAIGVGKIAAFHLNDSKADLGCRLDRHEHIGKGWIGLEAFRLLLNDPRFTRVPKYLETPKGLDLREDVENLAVLRALAGRTDAIAWSPPPGHGARGKTGSKLQKDPRQMTLGGAEEADGPARGPRERG